MDLLGNDVDILHEEIKYLVSHLVGNDVDTLHEERIHLVGFSFIRVIDRYFTSVYFKIRFTELPLILNCSKNAHFNSDLTHSNCVRFIFTRSIC